MAPRLQRRHTTAIILAFAVMSVVLVQLAVIRPGPQSPGFERLKRIGRLPPRPKVNEKAPPPLPVDPLPVRRNGDATPPQHTAPENAADGDSNAPREPLAADEGEPTAPAQPEKAAAVPRSPRTQAQARFEFPAKRSVLTERGGGFALLREQGEFEQGDQWPQHSAGGGDAHYKTLPWHALPKPSVPQELLALQEESSGPQLIEEAIAACGGHRMRVDFACLIRKYPSIVKSGECDRVFGHGRVPAFRSAQLKMCAGEAPASSAVSCNHLRITGHNKDTSICRGRNLQVQFSRMLDGDYPWLRFQKGALKAACDVPVDSQSRWGGMFMHCIADWFDLGFDAKGKDAPLQCDSWVNHTVYFVTRSGDFSPFAVTHDWLNTVLAFAVLGQGISDVQIVLMDRMPKGFYLPVWQWVFAPTYDLGFFPNLRKAFGSEKICFRDAVFNVPARLSPLYDNMPECSGRPGSPIYRAYSDFLMYSLFSHRTRSVASTLTITVIVRKDYKTGHKIGRRFGNLQELLEGLRRLKPADRNVQVRVNAVDFAVYDFDQQVNITRSTDLLVAMHGAGLIHIMYLQSYAGIFEFFCQEKPPSNYRYNRLAGLMGIQYDSFNIISAANTVPIGTVTPKLQSLLDSVAGAKLRRGK